ncbi:methyltransferase domain-containing protein [Stenotrophomonas maltophilia]|nr:methyltransferase domain-containing protein [Stenotrophomonas maltophilia]MBA0249524.1 methyltransferase domain-containing protein [Stenotrophomonas maltophilia]MBA0309168.1 methyltransferase domain-containing protein [Stenotrophomonas maltophilia]MBA0441176.1 methyltransferase domain-containing protein [Stenotrophomonas maltophilia]MBA0516242.1 methyltransferase domain-containing protein [Stenotrophomonas maltophilia]
MFPGPGESGSCVRQNLETMLMGFDQCPACEGQLKAGLQPWHLQCGRCSYEGSSLRVHIDVQGDREVLDEVLREEGLSDLRQRNFAVLAEDLAARFPQRAEGRPRLLDVGCAHGWFLQATEGHFEVVGIEPDARVADSASARGLPVRRGFFPDVLQAGEKFDVIVFNDVMEHIPDILSAMRACTAVLRPGGVVVINAPARTGVLYRVARVMARMGAPASFERLWQKGFPSPHVHYLDDGSMRAIGTRTGLSLQHARTLPSLSVKGLYARIRYDRSVSAAKAMALTAALSVLAPVMRLLPADIKVWMLQAESDPAGGMAG